MTKRNIPFGYRYENGGVVVCAGEAKTLKAIYTTYLGGTSLLKIAEKLNRDKVEYAPGLTGWNKARIMRLLDDRRYTGTGRFPQILSRCTYEAVQSTKASKNTQKGVDRSADIYTLKAPVLCPKCGGKTKRVNDSRRRDKHKWVCGNKECKTSIALPDADLLKQMTDTLNAVVANPEQIEIPGKAEYKPTEEIKKAESEISKAAENRVFDKDALREKMLRCAALKYESIDSGAYTAKMMKADFKSAVPLLSFSASLAAWTVKAVKPGFDGTVRLTLINGQTVGKETANNAEGGAR